MSAKKPPFNPDQLYQRALTLHHAGKLIDAESLYKTLLSYFPQQVEILTTLGIVLLQQGRSEAGIQQLKKSLNINPNQPAALYNMAVELQKIARLEEALACYNQTLKINPQDINSLINRGNTLKDLKQYKNAMASFEGALALQPNIASAHWNKALTHILLGEYVQGWSEYEWGWQCGERGQARNYSQPTWLGNGSIAGKTILIHPEQGLGDLIQFSRYIPLLEKLGAQVIIEAPASLLALMASLSTTLKVVKEGDHLPPFDFVCPIMSLPHALKTTVETIPNEVPYLRPSPDKAESWRVRLGEGKNLRVGIAWSGGFRLNQPGLWGTNERRNIPLQIFTKIALPHIDFYSLQKGEPAESNFSKEGSKIWTKPNLTNLAPMLLDFSDTAAVIENLDLVISVDTSTAHLAGAMGKPVLIPLAFDSCWRWLKDRGDSPWYPSAKLYRQLNSGDWAEVMIRVVADLKKLVTKTSITR